jgi:hypothetical protein
VPSYRVRLVGTDFDAVDEGADYPDTETAAREAVKAAIAVAADEASRGNQGAVLEARVEDGANVLARYVVALSVEQLHLP